MWLLPSVSNKRKLIEADSSVTRQGIQTLTFFRPCNRVVHSGKSVLRRRSAHTTDASRQRQTAATQHDNSLGTVQTTAGGIARNTAKMGGGQERGQARPWRGVYKCRPRGRGEACINADHVPSTTLAKTRAFREKVKCRQKAKTSTKTFKTYAKGPNNFNCYIGIRQKTQLFPSLPPS